MSSVFVFVQDLWWHLYIKNFDLLICFPSHSSFFLQCKPEYKVPGLYVIDSIVRQSRHQFGQEKDVFAPRFSNNIISTFQNLYRCPGDDKVCCLFSFFLSHYSNYLFCLNETLYIILILSFYVIVYSLLFRIWIFSYRTLHVPLCY